MKLVFACAVALGLAAGCTDLPATGSAAQDLELRCVNLCGEGRPCQGFCAFEKEDRLVLEPNPEACPAIHHDNVCGDNCCDPAEGLNGERECYEDCKVATLVVTWEGPRLSRLFYKDRPIAKVEDGLMSLENTCQ